MQAMIKPSDTIRSYTVPADGQTEEITLTPSWFGSIVWKGSRPEEVGSKAPREARQQDIVIDNVPGTIILNQLGSASGRYLHTSCTGLIVRRLEENLVFILSAFHANDG